jgi:hypothetical protein
MQVRRYRLLTATLICFALVLGFGVMPDTAMAQLVLEKERDVEGGLVIFKPLQADRDTQIGMPVSRMCYLVAHQDIHHNQACGCMLKPMTIQKPHDPGLKNWEFKILADVNANGYCMCQVMCEIEDTPKPKPQVKP